MHGLLSQSYSRKLQYFLLRDNARNFSCAKLFTLVIWSLSTTLIYHFLLIPEGRQVTSEVCLRAVKWWERGNLSTGKILLEWTLISRKSPYLRCFTQSSRHLFAFNCLVVWIQPWWFEFTGPGKALEKVPHKCEFGVIQRVQGGWIAIVTDLESWLFDLQLFSHVSPSHRCSTKVSLEVELCKNVTLLFLSF